MEKELKKAFQNLNCEDNPELCKDVWEKIVLRNKRIIHLKMWLFSVLGLSSLAGLYPAGKVLLADLSHSGIYEYFSLALSGGSVSAYWKEIAYSIAESLPTMSIVLSFSLLFIVFLSARYAARQFVRNQLVLSF